MAVQQIYGRIERRISHLQDELKRLGGKWGALEAKATAFARATGRPVVEGRRYTAFLRKAGTVGVPSTFRARVRMTSAAEAACTKSWAARLRAFSGEGRPNCFRMGRDIQGSCAGSARCRRN